MADRSDFQRQRRNLIIISLVLSFVELSGIEIKEINLFGNKLLIDNPEWVNRALWIGLFYWGYRYYTYFLKQDTGFKDEFSGRMNKRIIKQAVNKVLKDPELKDKISEEKKNKMKKAPIGDHIFVCDNISKSFVRVNTFNIDGKGIFITKDTKVSVLFNYWIAVKSMVNLLFNTPFFSEYILPFLLFTSPIVIWLYMHYYSK